MKDTAATKKRDLVSSQSCVESSPSVSQSVEVDATASTCLAIEPHSLQWTGMQLEIIGETLGRRKGIQDQRGTTNAFTHLVPHKSQTPSQRSAALEVLQAEIESSRAREAATQQELAAVKDRLDSQSAQLSSQSAQIEELRNMILASRTNSSSQ